MADFYDEYYRELKQAFDSNSVSIRYNKDRAHNAVIMSFMLDNTNVIQMYCGEISVLRSRFYDKIDEDHKTDSPKLGEGLKTRVIKSLVDFIKRDGTRLEIILEKDAESTITDMVDSKFYDAIQSGKIIVNYLPKDFPSGNALNHFSVTDRSMFRFEEEKDTHSAICCFNNDEVCGHLRKNFKILKSYSKKSDRVVINS